MGYGFSLFRNSADVCLLKVSKETLQKIANYERRQSSDGQNPSTINAIQPVNQQEREKMSSGLQNFHEHGSGHAREHDLKGNPLNNQVVQFLAQETHWVRTRCDAPDQSKRICQANYEFSPRFLQDSSRAFSNKRELTSSDTCLESCVDFSGARLSRNKLHVLCAVIMMLQKQHMAITEHEKALPMWPTTDRAFHAARYRRKQIQILSSAIAGLMVQLGRIIRLKTQSTTDFQIVRLEHILLDSPRDLLRDFRAALNAGLGTRNPAKIRKHGWVECAFTLWVCGLCLLKPIDLHSVVPSEDSLFSIRIFAWLQFLRQAYGCTPSPNADERKFNKVNEHRALRGCGPVNDFETTIGDDEDSFLSAESYLAVVEAAVEKNPDSLYRNPDVTLNCILWCLNVIREEGVMCPDLEGRTSEENDEYLLFIETKL